MASKNQPSNAVAIATVMQRIRALETYVAENARISVEGTHYDLRGFIAIYQRCLDTSAALTKRAEVVAEIALRETRAKARLDAERALKGWVRGEFGSRSKEALDFGFPPPRVHVRTTEEKAQVVARGKATREARGTMGRRERERIRGVLPEVAADDGKATNV